MTTSTTPQVSDPELDSGESIFAHLVPRDGDRSPSAVVMEALINGTPVTAFCGHTWVPSRDPNRYPLCTRCEEIFKQLLSRMGN
jgi:hypothetical protein